MTGSYYLKQLYVKQAHDFNSNEYFNTYSSH